MTGGVRSGKSTHAEALLAGLAAVTYVAPGRRADGTDPDWDARLALHRARRPADWSTVETSAIEDALRAAAGPVLVDCLGTWLTAVIDDAGLWEASAEDVDAVIGARVDAVCAALIERPQAVVVTNEVGFGVVPEHR